MEALKKYTHMVPVTAFRLMSLSAIIRQG